MLKPRLYQGNNDEDVGREFLYGSWCENAREWGVPGEKILDYSRFKAGDGERKRKFEEVGYGVVRENGQNRECVRTTIKTKHGPTQLRLSGELKPGELDAILSESDRKISEGQSSGDESHVEISENELSVATKVLYEKLKRGESEGDVVFERELNKLEKRALKKRKGPKGKGPRPYGPGKGA